jgi:hypothetical protein
MSITQRNDAHVVSVDPSLGEILRFHTLSVLERHHHAFEYIHHLKPDELLAAAAAHRDAIVILDIIGWLPNPEATTVEVPITPGHVTELRRLRADEGMSVLDFLELREDVDTSDDLAEIDDELAGHRQTANALLRLADDAGWHGLESWMSSDLR